MTRHQHGHYYLSTACFHRLHGRCIATCKFCGAPCSCEHCTHEPNQRYDGELFRALRRCVQDTAPIPAGTAQAVVRAVLNTLNTLPLRDPQPVTEDDLDEALLEPVPQPQGLETSVEYVVQAFSDGDWWEPLTNWCPTLQEARDSVPDTRPFSSAPPRIVKATTTRRLVEECSDAGT